MGKGSKRCSNLELKGRWAPAELGASPLLLPPSPHQVPAVEDIDKEQLGDPYASAEYAKDIFEYMRSREVGDAWPGAGSRVWGRGDHVSRSTRCPEALLTCQGPSWGGRELI